MAMEIRVKRPDGAWDKVDLASDLVSRRTANNTWFSFDPNTRPVVNKKVAKTWEDQVPKTRYR